MNLNKSFIYGICFSSITWLISLYLYWQLTTTKCVLKLEDDCNVISNNSLSVFKSSLKSSDVNGYVNGMDLVKQLQPINKEAVSLDEIGMVRTQKDRLMRDEGYKMYAFNVLISSHLKYNRTIPDTRNKL